MKNDDFLTVMGVVGTVPRNLTTAENLVITDFRLASTRSRYDSATKTWSDVGTNWYTVSAYRQLAVNANVSLRKGDHLIVVGKLIIREWESGEKRGREVGIEAISIGHDLTFGATALTRNKPATSAVEPEPRSEDVFPEENAPDSRPDGVQTPF